MREQRTNTRRVRLALSELLSSAEQSRSLLAHALHALHALYALYALHPNNDDDGDDDDADADDDGSAH
jgi:hypothetical protein